MITDAELAFPGPEIVYANQALCELTGYAVEELVGRSLRLLQGPRTDSGGPGDAVGGRRWAAVDRELVNYRKDGTEYLVRLQLVPMQNPAGLITHWMSTQQDITSGKELEHRLAQIEASLGAAGAGAGRGLHGQPGGPQPAHLHQPAGRDHAGRAAGGLHRQPEVWDRWLDPPRRRLGTGRVRAHQ